MKSNIKKMNLYKNASRILNDLEACGFAGESDLYLEILNKFDQLHYHGTDSVLDCIKLLDIGKSDLVLEVGAGWGGPSRFIASKTGSRVFALELQKDYSDVGKSLTERSKLGGLVRHINSDFLEFSADSMKFDKIVSWLALYHIPKKQEYSDKIFKLLNEGGSVFIEDLTLGSNHTDRENQMLENKLFANSLVHYSNYLQIMTEAGFSIMSEKDMSIDWKNFTRERLENLRLNKESYIKTHGSEGYEIIEDFYNTAYTSFEKEVIGGIRLVCKK